MKPARSPRRTLLPVLFFSILQASYMLNLLPDLQTISWKTLDLPVQFQIWHGLSESHPSVSGGSRVAAALEEALQRWARASSLVASLEGESPLAEARRDGVNLITMADTPHHRSVLGEVALGNSMIWNQGARIVEADILLNPAVDWSTSKPEDGWNLLQVTQHELGHSLGLGHTIDRASVMYFQGGTFEFDFNQLSWDDIAGLNALYPLPGIERLTGTLQGWVRRDGAPVPGAFVVACDEFGVLAASALSDPGGFYRISFLAPGRYVLYVEPLDGPVTPSDLGVDFHGRVDTDFQPRFYGDSVLPRVSVRAAEVAWAHFNLASGSTRLDPNWTRIDADPYLSGPFTALSAAAQRGRNLHFGVAGEGVAHLADPSAVSFLGSHLKTGKLSRAATNASGIDFKWFPLEVDEEAPQGSYSVLLQGHGELGVMSGVVEVVSRYPHRRNFARFAHDGQKIQSEIFLLNRSPSSACQGHFRPRAPDGQSLDLELHSEAPLVEDLSFRLAPGGLWSGVSRGDGSAHGSLGFEATCQLEGVLAIRTRWADTLLPGSRPLLAFQAPLLVDRARINTGISLANFDFRPARVLLQALDGEGRQVAETLVEIKSGGHVSAFSSEILDGLPPNFEGSLSVTSNRLMAAAVVRVEGNTWTSLPVFSNPIGSRLVFPVFAHLGSVKSDLILLNPHSLPVRNVQLRLRDESGSPLGVERVGAGGQAIGLPPHGMLRLKTTGQPPFSGSVEVQSELPLNAVVLIHSPTLGRTAILPSPISRDLVAAVVQEEFSEVGLALFNPGPRRTRLALEARDHQGQLAGEQVFVELAPYQRLARFLNQEPFRLGLKKEFRGSLWIRADGKVAASLVRQSKGHLTSWPVLSPQDDSS